MDGATENNPQILLRRLFLGTPTFADCDGDGVFDYMDDCLDSDMNPTIVIDGCQTHVANHLFDTGCTMSDLIAQCGDGSADHGAFVSCVARLAGRWKRDGLISGEDKGHIQSCAGQAGPP